MWDDNYSKKLRWDVGKRRRERKKKELMYDKNLAGWTGWLVDWLTEFLDWDRVGKMEDDGECQLERGQRGKKVDDRWKDLGRKWEMGGKETRMNNMQLNRADTIIYSPSTRAFFLEHTRVCFFFF
jgi:hypothetical protein